MLLIQCSSVNLRQSDSSDLSLQSGSPSHFQVSLTHSPLAQRNSPAVQFARLLSRTPSLPQRSGPSSELSEQSGSPSQLHMSGTHSEVLQRRWLGPQVRGEEHLSSSLPSPQSSSPSHTYVVAKHFRLAHMNSPLGQALASGEAAERNTTMKKTLLSAALKQEVQYLF